MKRACTSIIILALRAHVTPFPIPVRLIYLCFDHRYKMFTGLETPNELHNRGALTDAHAHAALIILIVVKRDQYSLLSRQLK